MTRPVLLLALASLLTWAPTARAQDAAFVMPNTAACTVPADGPGSTPETAIPAPIADLVHDAEMRREFGDPSRFDCRWVRTAGYFSWADYWHYRGRLHGTPLGDRNSPWIEGFANNETRRANLQTRQIEVIGLFYDLCAIAAAERIRSESEDGIILLNMGGPCHYGDLNGLMLSDVRLLAVLSEPAYLRGEANRAFYGDLVDADELRPGATQAMQHSVLQSLSAFARSEGEGLALTDWSRDRAAEALNDPDDWTSVVAARSAQIAQEHAGAFDTIPFRAFFESAVYSDDPAAPAEVRDFSRATACFCTSADCENAWPLQSHDAYRMAHDILCLELEQEESGEWRVAP